jgi:hypothetical protein
MKNRTNDATSTFNDYARMLALMRAGVATACDLTNPRMADFHHALEVAWAAARKKWISRK